MEESLREFMAELVKRNDENYSLIKEIRASTDAAIRNQGASIKALEIQIGQMSNVLQERGYGSLLSSTKTTPRDHLKSISTTKEVDIHSIHRIKPNRYGILENVLMGINIYVVPVDFIVLYMPEDIKIPLILERPFLSTAHAKIDVFKRKFALRIENDKIVFKSDGPTTNLIKKLYVLGLREQMEIDLEARLIGEALILNKSQDPEFGYFLELNDLNEPLELTNHENEDLDPKIEEG
ncbi:hypothetical protein Tco_1039888 [Tanacetum coccineum]